MVVHLLSCLSYFFFVFLFITCILLIKYYHTSLLPIFIHLSFSFSCDLRFLATFPLLISHSLFYFSFIFHSISVPLRTTEATLIIQEFPSRTFRLTSPAFCSYTVPFTRTLKCVKLRYMSATRVTFVLCFVTASWWRSN